MDRVSTLKYALPQDTICYQYEQCWKLIANSKVCHIQFDAWAEDVTIRENLEFCVQIFLE